MHFIWARDYNVVTDLMSKEAVIHSKEANRSVTQNDLECFYVTVLEIISESLG